MKLGLILLTLFAIVDGAWASTPPPSTKEESRWRLRLPAEDRSAIDSNLGYALPKFQ